MLSAALMILTLERFSVTLKPISSEPKSWLNLSNISWEVD